MESGTRHQLEAKENPVVTTTTTADKVDPKSQGIALEKRTQRLLRNNRQNIGQIAK